MWDDFHMHVDAIPALEYSVKSRFGRIRGSFDRITRLRFEAVWWEVCRIGNRLDRIGNDPSGIRRGWRYRGLLSRCNAAGTAAYQDKYKQLLDQQPSVFIKMPKTGIYCIK
jgi:hypothetical protein